MVKILIVGIAVALLLWLIFGRNRRGGKTPSRRRDEKQSEPMVICAHCGVHLPRSEALAARGLHYCSAAHRDGAAPP